MRAIIVTGPDKVEVREVPDHMTHLVIPVPAPPQYASALEPLPPIAQAYPTILLDRHHLRHEADPSREWVAFWPNSWADSWGMDAIRRSGVLR